MWSIQVEAIGEITAAGVAGPPVVPLVPFPGDDGVVAWCAAGIEDAVINAIVAAPADHYVNVHTVDHPGVAVRGQLTP